MIVSLATAAVVAVTQILPAFAIAGDYGSSGLPGPAAGCGSGIDPVTTFNNETAAQDTTRQYTDISAVSVGGATGYTYTGNAVGATPGTHGPYWHELHFGSANASVSTSEKAITITTCAPIPTFPAANGDQGMSISACADPGTAEHTVQWIGEGHNGGPILSSPNDFPFEGEKFCSEISISAGTGGNVVTYGMGHLTPDGNTSIADGDFSDPGCQTGQIVCVFMQAPTIVNGASSATITLSFPDHEITQGNDTSESAYCALSLGAAWATICNLYTDEHIVDFGAANDFTVNATVVTGVNLPVVGLVLTLNATASWYPGFRVCHPGLQTTVAGLNIVAPCVGGVLGGSTNYATCAGTLLGVTDSYCMDSVVGGGGYDLGELPIGGLLGGAVQTCVNPFDPNIYAVTTPAVIPGLTLAPSAAKVTCLAYADLYQSRPCALADSWFANGSAAPGLVPAGYNPTTADDDAGNLTLQDAGTLPGGACGLLTPGPEGSTNDGFDTVVTRPAPGDFEFGYLKTPKTPQLISSGLSL